MEFISTEIAGLFIVKAKPHRDSRGFYARAYCPEAFAEAGILFTSNQINLSRNLKALTLRGMHYQDPPHAEAKYVRVTRGRAYDVAVDIRPGSPTYGRWAGVELSADEANAFFLPEGMAHGFLTLEPDTDVLYQVNRAHIPGIGKGYRYDDPALKIDWPAKPEVVLERDLDCPPFPMPR